MNAVLSRSFEDGRKGLIENLTVGIAGDVSPLLPPIVFECLSPFLSWRFDRFGEGDFVQGNQVVAERLVADGQEK